MSERDMQPEEQNLINLYRAWGAYDESLGEEATYEALDCDVAPELDNPLHFESIDEVRSEVGKQLDVIPTGDKELAPIRQKLAASAMYLAAEYGNEEVTFTDFIRTTMGAKPIKFDIAPDDKEAVELDARVREMGRAWGVDLAWDERFRDEFRRVGAAFANEEEARRVFGNEVREGNLDLAELLGGDVEEVVPGIYYDDESEKARTYTKDDKPQVDFSLHERHEWPHGETMEVPRHEMAHVAHLYRWKHMIDSGQMSPALGVTTIHTPEMTHFETFGLGAGLVTIAHKNTPVSDFQILYSPRGFKVRSNASYMMGVEGADIEEAAQYVREHLPLDPIDDLVQFLEDRRDLPLVKAYHGAYALGIEMISPVLEMPKEKQTKILRALFTSCLSAQQVAETIAQAAA